MNKKIKSENNNYRKLSNQLVVFLNDKNFLTILKEYGEKFVDQKRDPVLMIQCKKEIDNYLFANNYPLTWKEPLFNIVSSKNDIDFPLGNSISLIVGSQEVTKNTKELLIIKNNKTGKLVDTSQTISIKISSKVTPNQIIDFVKRNESELEYWMDEIGLPEYKQPDWRRIDLALKIIRMKDEQELTFSGISKKLTDLDNLTLKEHDYFSKEENIKTTYYRFKKRLNLQ